MEKLWNFNYVRIMIANFCIHFSFYVLAPLLPLYLSETFGAGKDMIGLVLSGYTVTALLLRPFSGYLADSFPRKRVLMIGFFLYVFFFVGYFLAGTLLLFAVIRTAHGGPFGATTVANSTIAIDALPPSRRNEGIGYYGLSNNVATAIAPTVGIFIYNYCHRFDLIFLIALLVGAAGLLANSQIKIAEKQVLKDKSILSLDRFFLLRGWLIGANIAFFGLCYGTLSNYLAIYGKEVLGITGGTGAYFLLLSSGLILSRLRGAKELRDGHLTGNAAKGVLIATAGYTLFAAGSGMVGYYVSAILIGLGNGLFWPAFQNMMINVAQHNERGTANSTLFTSWDAGVGLGILVGGVVAEHMGYAEAFQVTVVAHLVGAILFFAGTRRFFLARRRAV